MVPRTLTPPPGLTAYKSDSNGNSIAAAVTNGDNNGIEEEDNDIMETNGNDDDNLVEDNGSNDGDNGGENGEQKEQFQNGEVRIFFKILHPYFQRFLKNLLNFKNQI